MFVGCLLRLVRTLLSVDWWPLFRCVLYVVCRSLASRCLLLAVSCLLFVVCRLLFSVVCAFVVCCWLFVVCCVSRVGC